MAVSKQKKAEILDQLRKIFDEKSVLLLTTNGTEASINASSNHSFRSMLDEQNIVTTIAKNTLIRLVLEEKGLKITEEMTGQTHVQFMPSGDEVSVIKAVLEVMKAKFSKNFNVLGSVVNSQFMDQVQTENLSKVPSYKDSMSMVASALNSVIAKIAIGVKEVPTSIARGVQAIPKQ